MYLAVAVRLLVASWTTLPTQASIKAARVIIDQTPTAIAAKVIRVRRLLRHKLRQAMGIIRVFCVIVSPALDFAHRHYRLEATNTENGIEAGQSDREADKERAGEERERVDDRID